MPRSSTSLHARRAFMPPTAGAAALPFVPEFARCPWRWLATGGSLAQRMHARRVAASRMRALSAPLLLCSAQPRAHYKRVLVPVDFSPSTLAAARLAARMSVPLIFLASFTLPDAAAGLSGFARAACATSLVDARDAVRGRLTQFVDELDIAHDLVSVVARHGSFEIASADYAHRRQCDLLVLGQRTASPLQTLLGGGTEWRMHRQLGIDVLVVPA